jgi:hypothetical protein
VVKKREKEKTFSNVSNVEEIYVKIIGLMFHHELGFKNIKDSASVTHVCLKS